MNPIILHYTEPVIRDATRGIFIHGKNRNNWFMYFATAILLGIMATWHLARGDFSWKTGILIAFASLAACLPFIAYFAHWQASIARFRALCGAEVTLSIMEENFTITSPPGNSTLLWSAVMEVLKFPTCWLLAVGPTNYIILPLHCLDSEAQAYITRKTSKA